MKSGNVRLDAVWQDAQRHELDWSSEERRRLAEGDFIEWKGWKSNAVAPGHATVCFTCPYSISRITGVGTFVETLSDALRARGVDSLLVYPGPRRARRTDSDRVTRLRWTAFRNLELAARTARLLLGDRGNFTVVHAQHTHLQSVAAMLVAKILGRPTILTLHLKGSSSTRPARRWFDLAVESLSMTLADVVVAVSPQLAHGFGDRPIAVIENGVDTQRFQPSEESRRRIREKLGLGDEFVWVFAGRWSRQKGLDILLEALAHAPPSKSPFYVLVLGARAPDEPDLVDVGLRNLGPSGRVKILGFVENLPEYLAVGDALVLPSRAEGMSMTFLEALACGLPILASDIAVHRMLIERSGCGWTFRSEDARDLSHRMAEISTNGVPSGWSARAREVAERFYSLSLVASRYEELYQSLAK